MGVGAIAGIIGAAATLASIGYAASQSPPGYPTGNAQAAGVLAQAAALPYQRGYTAAAEQGTTALKSGYGTTDATWQRKHLQAQLDAMGPPGTRPPAGSSQGLVDLFQNKNATREQLQAQLNALPKSGIAYYDPSGKFVPASEALVDFKGYGTADVQGELGRQMAAMQLGLQQKYGTQFAQQAKDELALSDPQGTAARAKLYDLIEQQNNTTPDRPVATLLDQQVQQQLSSGNRLDPAMRAVLDDEIAKAQAARGQDAGANTQQFATPLETGFEGQQRQLAANQKATGWLSSGATPEDVQYRREQQNLSNLGSFVQGQTPEAQFKNLSGAQQGTTPQVNGAPLPQAGNGAGAVSQGYTTGAYLQNLKYQQSQANPWMAGLSSALNLAGAANKAGAFG